MKLPSIFTSANQLERRAFYLAVVAAVLAAVGLFVDGGGTRRFDPNYPQIGTLTRSGDDVKLKAFSDNSFSHTNETDVVYLKDTLYAGPGTRVSLNLGDYGSFDLDPNTVVLMVLDFEMPEGEEEETMVQIAGPNAGKPAPVTMENKTLKIAFTQGKLKFKKSGARQKATAVQIADGAKIMLTDQTEFAMEKNQSGQIRVTKADKPAQLVYEAAERRPSKTVELKVGDVIEEKAVVSYVENAREIAQAADEAKAIEDAKAAQELRSAEAAKAAQELKSAGAAKAAQALRSAEAAKAAQEFKTAQEKAAREAKAARESKAALSRAAEAAEAAKNKKSAPAKKATTILQRRGKAEEDAGDLPDAPPQEVIEIYTEPAPSK